MPPAVGPIEPAPLLTDLELSYGVAFGHDVHPGEVAPVPDAIDGRVPVDGPPPIDVAEALDRALGAALSRPPCLISFSGGRDSSALLAWATRLARREGYPLPIPATLLIPGDADAEESSWQQHVLDHLDLTERLVFTVHGEMDAVGPVAATALHRHGLLWPFNTHLHTPIVAAAGGGAVITGFGGDELGRSSQFARAAQVLGGRRSIRRTDPLVVGLALSPAPIQRAVFRRRNAAELEQLSWLRPAARRRLGRALAADEATVPLSWASTLTSWFATQRYYRICRSSFAVLGGAYNTTVHHPFVDPLVLRALARVGGFGGLGSRAALVNTLFGDVLPAEIINRESKASFSNVLWTDTARSFARSWSGGGLEGGLSELIDPEALRRHWHSDAADMRSLALLQTAWLHDHPDP